MTINEAKKKTKQILSDLNIDFDKITAKNSGFSDLARDGMIFVTVKGANKNLKEAMCLAKNEGFRIMNGDSLF
jgi:hypothetical protein